MKPNTPSKQRVNVLLLVGLLCWSTPGFGTGHELTPVSGNPARGRDLFIAHGCLTCHAVRGSGGRTAPDLAAAMVDAGMGRIGAAILDHPPGSGPPAAPAYPSLQAADRDDLLAYFFFVNFAGESGSAANGALVFSRKGCTKCHWAGAAGDASVPRALSLARSTPPVALAQLMWNHVTQMSISPAERGTSKFVGHEMADLLAFLSGAADPLTNRGAVPFADPDVGRQLFRSKGCAKCHGQNAAGGLEGHPLLAPRQCRTVAEIAGAMWNHRFVLPEHPAEARLNQDEMLALIAYFNLPQTAP